MVIDSVLLAANHFTRETVNNISELGNGLINDTYLVNTEAQLFVLQRFNTQIFSDFELIINNHALLIQHLSQKKPADVNLKIPKLLKTLSDANFLADQKGNIWRAYEYIDQSESKETISDLNEAKQLGFALAHFHRLFSDVVIKKFHDTLPGFHVTPTYFQHYLSVEDKQGSQFNCAITQQCRQFITSFQTKINSIEIARSKGHLTQCITHGDPKLNNFLFKKGSHKILSLIDLDTVKPGLIHQDIADCLRSCCHSKDTNSFDLKICTAVLKSYLKEMHSVLTDWDYHYLYFAIELMPFELGLRFFTDFLQGNVYFKVDSAEQNLIRAVDQFQLCESIGKQRIAIEQLIFKCKMANK